MANTITSYFTFVSQTPAKSSEVNANFGNYRGGFLPIDTTTTSAPNNTYNLGTFEHRWLGHYAPTMRSDLDAGMQILNNGSTIAAYSSNYVHRQIYNEAHATDQVEFGGSWSYARAIATNHIVGVGACYVHDVWTATTYGKPVLWKVTTNVLVDVGTRHLAIFMMKGQNTSRGTILLVASLTGTQFTNYTVGAEIGPNDTKKNFSNTFHFYDFSPGQTTEVYSLISCTEEFSAGDPSGRAGVNLNGVNIKMEQIF